MKIDYSAVVRRWSAPMPNVEATGQRLTEPKSAGSARCQRPPTSASTHSFHPLETSESPICCWNRSIPIGPRGYNVDVMLVSRREIQQV